MKRSSDSLLIIAIDLFPRRVRLGEAARPHITNAIVLHPGRPHQPTQSHREQIYSEQCALLTHVTHKGSYSLAAGHPAATRREVICYN